MAKKREADVQFDFAEIDKKIAEHINDNAEQIARQIAADARASVNVVTGNLKKGIRAKRSKFDDGGWIVISRAPHSHLVEFGHENAPAYPFLRPALDRNIAAAKALFGVRD